MIKNFIKSGSQILFKTYPHASLSSIYGSTISRKFSGISDEFMKAKSKITQLTNDPGPEHKLKLYALFKQATDGRCTKPKPSMINFVEKAKWDAWTQLEEMNKDDAMKGYIGVVESLWKEQGMDEKAVAPEKTSTSGADTAADSFKISTSNGVLTLRLDRPSKMNAITWEMYEFWADTLYKADKDPAVKIVLITGTGDYFCSGNDLSNFTKMGPDTTPPQMAARGNKVLQKFVSSFIDFGKPLIAAINGPAIGISVTTLGLYDAVYASDKATFSTPFSNLGQTPEGCSSYTFPLIFGPMKAREMLMFNRKLTSTEALGLVTQVFPHNVFMEEVTKKVNEIAELPPQTLRYAKELICGPVKSKMHEVNKAECNRLQERWLDDECVQAIMKFFSSKTK